jgi:predicted GNAT family N-acyltransferase
MAITIFQAKEGADIENALKVRHQVFVLEQHIDQTLQCDGLDVVCDHFVAYDGNIPVGAGRIRYPQARTAKIERMAVLSEYRGQHIGSGILKKMIEYLRERKLDQIVMNAQTHARPFYEKYGFVVEGEEFLEAGISHVRMVLKI